MGILDFFMGGNSRVAAKSTVDIFNDGISMYGDLDLAYRYTYIFRSNTIAKHIQHQRDVYVANLFRQGDIANLTHITIANLNTGAAPSGVYFEQTYHDFHQGVSKDLRKFGVPEKYITGQNTDSVIHILNYLAENEIVPSEMYDCLVNFEVSK